MSAEKLSSKPVRVWLSLLDDPHSPLYRKLDELYGNGEALTAGPARLCRRAVEAFGHSYGWDKSSIIARSTGRINLMGMHIDHRGGFVNPIAVKEVFLVAEPRDDDTVVLRNVESDEFPEEQFRIGACLPRQKIANWDNWCHDEFEKRKGDPGVTWSNYVRAGVLYLQHLHTEPGGEFAPALRGMNAMVYGNVPRAAGLSSSSSLVVAAAEACVHLNALNMDSMRFVEACSYGEWYVGTRGGAGDHAAIKFGRPHSILHMGFFPLTVENVHFPPGYRIVLANSLVQAKKQTGARDAFNNRVSSYIFGLMLVREKFPQYAPRLEHLRDINPKSLHIDEAEIYRIIGSLPLSASRSDVLSLLPEKQDELRQVFRSHAEPQEGYKIRQVCLYGVAECIRSELAAERLEEGDVKGFGELMSISHDGDRVTRLVDGKGVATDNTYRDEKIRALINNLRSGSPQRVERARLWRQPGGYDVSVPELDILVDICLASRGVTGARLVGAGLGGSIVAIVEERHATELIENLAKQYYQPRGLPVCAEAVVPVGGSSVITV